nr:MAG TPA: hypothetical protein [Caudoviricetes sp.]
MGEKKETKITLAQRRAFNKYKNTKCKQVVIQFYPTDMHIYDMLKCVDNKTRYIKDLIKKDLGIE